MQGIYSNSVGKEDQVGRAIADSPSHTTVHTDPYTAILPTQTLLMHTHHQATPAPSHGKNYSSIRN